MNTVQVRLMLVSTNRDPLGWLDDYARAREAAGLRRTVTPRAPYSESIDLASNDYLGLAKHPAVVSGAVAAVERWGTGSTGSALVTGATQENAQLEAELAAFVGVESGLTFASGYAANLGAVTALAGRGSLVVSDAGCHASLVDACRLSRGHVEIARHKDVEHVADLLASRTEERALVLTDSVFSADGALAPLAELYEVCRDHSAVLLVDEAHGLGVRGSGGRGLVEELRLNGQPDIVVTATLSKAFASQGGMVLASDRVRAHLIDSARTFIFDTALAPAAVGAARAALAVLQDEPDRATKVLARAHDLARIAHVDEPTSAVVSIVLGDAHRAYTAAQKCRELGVNVGCFRPPSVPEGTSRLRLTARADLTEDQLAHIDSVLTQVLNGARA